MSEVTIEYCVPCGFRQRAVDLGGAILASLERELDSLTFATGAHGVFVVRVDGETVYDDDEDDRDVDGIVRAVRDRL